MKTLALRLFRMLARALPESFTSATDAVSYLSTAVAQLSRAMEAQGRAMDAVVTATDRALALVTGRTQ